MALTFFNTLSGKKEPFEPITPGIVRMYHCGPTVYDYAHIGNLRAYVFADTLRRVIEYSGLKVEQVINITDIGHLTSDADSGDDKMTKGLNREGLPLTLEGLKSLADKYESFFKEDLKSLNIKEPHHFPRATEYLKEDIEIIEKLSEKGFTYKTEDGIYFDTAKLPDYGKLGGLTPLSESVERVGTSGKKNSRDFALWKFSKDGGIGFESTFGRGFPGWHIECSAMSGNILGQPFDIHTGGTDHIPVHHNNEIAQSEAAYEKPLARFWLHNAFVITDGGRMAKSAGTFVTLLDIKSKGIDPLAYRYFLLGAQYRSPINFSPDALEASGRAFAKLLDSFISLGDASGTVSKEYKDKFIECVNDDLNTPKALAVLWELIKDDNVSPADKRATILDFDTVLGLNIEEGSANLKEVIENVPADVMDLVEKREDARKNGDFKEADKIRNDIQKLGFSVEDTPEGPRAKPL